MHKIREDILGAAAVFGKTSADIVYGEGPQGARVMLVGEAPGAEETRLLRPFVGKAGKNLDEFLEVLSLSRNDIYITNVVKFRPFKVSEKGRLSNRPPAKEEIACMLPYLLREIEAVAPRVVVTLGNVPLKSLTRDSRIVIGACHAQCIPAAALTHEYTLFPLYHPASLIYNHALKTVYQQDVECLKSYLFAVT